MSLREQIASLKATKYSQYQVLAAVPANIVTQYALNWMFPGTRKSIYGYFKGNGFSLPLLLFVLACFFIDDGGTGIGLQAHEIPRTHVEGNPFMSYTWCWMIDNGWAKTETAAARLVMIWQMFMVVLVNYLGYAGPVFKLMATFMGLFKVWAGLAWWKLKPNDFTVTDFLSFKDGRRCPERLNMQTMEEFNTLSENPGAFGAGANWEGLTNKKNIYKGFMAQLRGETQAEVTSAMQRRRLVQQPVTGAAWVVNYLPFLWPI